MINTRTVLFAASLFVATVVTGCIDGRRNAEFSTAEGDTGLSGDSDEDTKGVNPCPSDACYINGVCREAGYPDPNNTCRLCDPDTLATGYSPREDATPCDDNEPCTLTSACSAGRCKGTLEQACVDIPTCVDHVACDEKGCWPVLKPDTCLIDGACWGPNAVNDSGCGWCDPTSPFVWTDKSDGVPCNEPDLCVVNSVCDAGACIGEPRDCDDGLACTRDSCSGGLCTHTQIEGTCLIDGECFAEGDREEPGSCLVCDPQAPTEWRPNDGAGCSVDDQCQASGTCNGFTCVTEPLNIDPEDNGGLEAAAPLSPTPAPGMLASASGNLNPPSDDDWFLYELASDSGDTTLRPRASFSFVTDKLEGCLLVACDSTDGSALQRPNPTVACSEGLEPKRTGSFDGCCLSADSIATQITLAAHCASGTGKAAVYVRRFGVTESACPSYEFAWGTAAQTTTQ